MSSLASALSMDEETRLKAAPIARSLIDRAIVSPGKNLKGVHIEITGKLASIRLIANAFFRLFENIPSQSGHPM